LGKAITSLGGGCSKLFVVEGKELVYFINCHLEGNGYSGILSALHPLEREDEKYYPGLTSKV
jgi:hypothetical protein